MQYFEQNRNNGGQLIVVDPRRSPTADAAHLHLETWPETGFSRVVSYTWGIKK